jgi:hypothetical protein
VWRLLALTLGIMLVCFGSAVAWSAFQVHAADQQRQADVRRVVQEIRGQRKLPLQIDSITTWTSVRAEHDAVHFFYAVAPTFDSATVSSQSIRERLRATACSVPAAQDVLEDGAELRFTYRFNDSDRRLTVAFDEDDCR